MSGLRPRITKSSKIRNAIDSRGETSPSGPFGRGRVSGAASIETVTRADPRRRFVEPLPAREPSPRRIPYEWISAVAITLWMAVFTPISAQEAYYWTYSQHLDWSYFDHPPMVAWGIACGDGLFAPSVFGVRLMTVLWSFGTTAFCQALLGEFGASLRTRRLWVVCSLGLPFLAFGRLIANPDAPLMFFWSACIYGLWRARAGQFRWWLATGLAAGGALLSKYTSVFLGMSGVIALMLDGSLRRQFFRIGPWVALALAIACFTPVVLWNAENDWASFSFQTQNRFDRGEIAWGGLGKFVAEQAGMFSPFLVFLVPATSIWLVRRALARKPFALWILVFAIPLFAYMACTSIYVRPKPNWVMPALLPMALGVLLWSEHTQFYRRRSARWVIAGVFVTILFAAFSPALHCLKAGKGTSWTGWQEVASRVDHWRHRLAAEGDPVFLFAADYRDASQLSFHLRCESSTAVPPVLAQNVFGYPALCYDFWTDAATHVGEDAILVLIRPEDRPQEIAAAQSHFREIEKKERLEVHRLGHLVLVADIFVCRGYLGPL